MTDLSDMTPDQLQEHIKTAEKELKRKEEQRLADLRKEVEEFAKSRGTSVAELFGTGRQQKPKPTKRVLYIDDHGNSFGRAKSSWTPEQKERFRENCHQRGSNSASAR
jgi:hypothetical protein